MELRRESDKQATKRQRAVFELKRVRTEFTLILVCAMLSVLLPKEAIMGVLGLFITKTLFVVVGVLVAHSSRKFLFPYLDLQKMIEEHHWGGIGFMTAWYFVIIYAFAVGG